jgi:hypothetical protein
VEVLKDRLRLYDREIQRVVAREAGLRHPLHQLYQQNGNLQPSPASNQPHDVGGRPMEGPGARSPLGRQPAAAEGFSLRWRPGGRILPRKRRRVPVFISFLFLGA